MSRLAARVRRLEGARGSCGLCGGVGLLNIVIGSGPAPDRRCARCGREPILMRIVEITKEQFDAQQMARQAHHAA